MEKVSIVITSWNRKNDLKRTLQSIYNQTYTNLEIIVVDNHSTDGTIELIKRAFPKVKFIVMSDSSYGACETFNIGFMNASGEYIAILDDDVFLPKEWIEKTVKKFRAEPDNTAMIATKIIDPLGLMWPSKEKENKEFYCGNFIGAGAVVKKEALKKTRYYPKEYFIYWNEEELSAQLLNRGYRIKYFPETTTYHKGNPSQRMSRKRFYFETRNRLWTFWMHDPIRKLIRKTILHLIAYFLCLEKGHEPALYTLTYIKSVFDAVKGLPTCASNREVVNSPYWDVKR